MIDKTEILELQQQCSKHGLPFDVLCDRLRCGCSLYAALNIPSNLNIKSVTQYPEGPRYTICEDFPAQMYVFDGTEDDLKEFIGKKNT